ncbi:tetratricopeptide repeat protein [Actinocrispum sp. NPDC049592]|uniref:tetratricopeptide repeat protein n=1 Tax=Actinocrispum sp. NPDC049592 TaxID=3154835 RepID=UPI003412B743
MSTGGWEALIEAAFRTSDYSEARVLLEKNLAEADGEAAEATASHELGWLLHFEALDRLIDGGEAGDIDAEEALFQRALTIRRQLGDTGGVAQSAFGLGLVHQVLRRDWGTAVPLFQEALDLAQDLLTKSEAHRHMGFYYLYEAKQPDEAVRHLRASLDLRHEYRDERWTPSGTMALGQAYLAAGDRAEAIKLLRQAVQESRDAGLHPRRTARAEQTLREALE